MTVDVTSWGVGVPQASLVRMTAPVVAWIAAQPRCFVVEPEVLSYGGHEGVNGSLSRSRGGGLVLCWRDRGLVVAAPAQFLELH